VGCSNMATLLIPISLLQCINIKLSL
jgi:hypothetical protein